MAIFTSNRILNCCFLFSLISRAAAQPPPVSDDYYRSFSPSMAVIIVVLVAALFFMGFFSIYIRHCNDSSAGNSVRQALSLRRRAAAAAARGLDAAVLETFPTFTYAEVKDHKVGKGALECAVCLNEFEDDETLRLIPKCDHVFHPECIDAWLESHVTCPVCRANLTPQPGDEPSLTPELPIREEDETANANEQPSNNEVSIHISSDQDQREQEDQMTSMRAKSVRRNLSFNVQNRPPRSFSIKRPKEISKFRSHSTGHSLVVPSENLDRYTLRLPEQVRKEVMNRALLNRARSMAVQLPGEGSARRGFRTGVGEGSSRAGRSDRWQLPQFFSRWPSLKSPKVVAERGESSTSASGGKTAVRLPSFKCLEPKGDEAGLVSADSARLPV